MASVQEFQALNREMASLARAGVPMELGLSHLSRTLPRRIGGLSGRIADRLKEGRSLIDALHLEGRQVSGTYIAVVEAALETNRLPEALDALVEHGAAVQDLRRRFALALLYPSIVVVMAYVLFWVFVLKVTPTVIATLEMAPEKVGSPLRPLQAIWQAANDWWWLAPAGLVLLLLFLARVFAGAVNATATTGRFFSGAWFPGVASVYADLDRSHVTGLLRLLVEHGVPLPRALRFAGAAAQSSSLRAVFERLAEGSEHGRSLRELVGRENSLPPLIGQLFTAGELEGRLSDALAQASTIYRRRAVRRADWLRTVLTPVLVTVIGGGVTFLYGASLFVPLRGLWFGL